MKSLILLIATMVSSVIVQASCPVRGPHSRAMVGLGDALFEVLSRLQECPSDVFALKAALRADGLLAQPAMVANRGRHNPQLGSFSFFEVVSGHSSALNKTVMPEHFYFGHFTQVNLGVVDLDQSPEDGKLLIELIAWDFTKELYNFYELRGTGSTSVTWWYRGDSRDAFLDNKKLHLQVDPMQPKFGKRMRCSACHVSGEPIMKELSAPHNDWWTVQRPLPLGDNKPSPALSRWLAETIDASQFAKVVKQGMHLLDQSSPMQRFKQGLSLQEQLRPLFCTQEINLISDLVPIDAGSPTISIAAQYFVNPLLFSAPPVLADRTQYINSLQQGNFKFPETSRRDADHAWLAPVKGYADLLAIQKLIRAQVVTAKVAQAILAVDLKNPLFSSGRCGLLRLVPRERSGDWLPQFIAILRQDGGLFAQELLTNLNNGSRISPSPHEEAARVYLQTIGKWGMSELFLQLEQRRSEVFTNEISKNPLGQILEPGFKVIFPERQAVEKKGHLRKIL